jgi:hypothetical protein
VGLKVALVQSAPKDIKVISVQLAHKERMVLREIKVVREYKDQ